MEYIDDQEFIAVNYSDKEIVKGNYEGCVFKRCTFSGVNLSGFTFIETEFIDCDLSNVQISQASFQDVIFKNCKMLGLQFDQCNHFGFAVNFHQCLLNHSSFYEVKLNKSMFAGCQLLEVDFASADLGKIVIKDCDLSGAVFEFSNMEKADFRGSLHYSIDPERNKIKGGIFSMPEVLGLLDKYGIKIEK